MSSERLCLLLGRGNVQVPLITSNSGVEIGDFVVFAFGEESSFFEGGASCSVKAAAGC